MVHALHAQPLFLGITQNLIFRYCRNRAETLTLQTVNRKWNINSKTKEKEKKTMKPTIVIYGSSTGTCQSIAETIASKLGVEAIEAGSLAADVIASHDNLLLGTSTWGAGELQDDWYDGIKTLKSAGLSGKTVALFGCGDSESYPDTFCGGMKELYDAAKEAGANVLEGVSTDGYTFDESEAVVDGRFVGLALDDVNEDDKTEERIDAWLEAIKPAL